MLRAVLVGFVLGFAMIGGIRLAEAGDKGAQLTSAQALHRGAALDHVADSPCPPESVPGDFRPMLLLI